jgi:ABC-2 type transport system permease protein
MQYPTSFLMLTIGQFTITLVEFVGLWSLFRRFGQVDGWTIGQVAVFYGVINISFAIADAISRGFETFGTDFVKTGAFDRILMRPRATALQILGHEIRLNRVGRLLQGLLVLAIASKLSAIDWNASNIFLLLVTVTGGSALFVGILVLQGTLAFWTVESLEVANTLTYGGVEAAQYPLDIYSRYFRDFLIFVVPIGCVSYFPVERLLGRADRIGAPNWMLVASPMIGFMFLAFSLSIWRFGVRHYTSTGS